MAGQSREYVINTLEDVSQFGTANDENWSLREALVHSAGAWYETDFIRFDPVLFTEGTGELELTLGALAVNSPVEITGPGASMLTVRADGGSGVFVVGSSTLDTFDSSGARIADLTITGGGGVDLGGGVKNSGYLTLSGVVVTDNRSQAGGGGVYTDGPALRIENSTISENEAGWGGGVRGDLAANETIVIEGSAIIDNRAHDWYWGSGNGSGAGLYVGGSSSLATTHLKLLNSTVGGNEADRHGGGLALLNGVTAQIVNSTIAYNEAIGGPEGGGGMHVSSALSGSILMQNTIVANNTAPASPSLGDMYGWKQAGQANPILTAQSLNNLVGMNHSTMGLPTTGNLYGSYATPLNPQLTPLADNGGASATYGLAPTSPAIDAGSDAAAAAASLTTDQRGRNRSVTRNLSLSDYVDIGAYELALVVSTPLDAPDGNDYSHGHLSLREAIDLAYSLPGKDFIEFDAALLAGETITISDDFELTSDLEILGLGRDSLTIESDGTDRVFTVAGGVTAAVRDLMITGGGGVTSGGGVMNSGYLTLSGVVVTGNTASNGGGGVYSDGPSLRIEKSTISSNEAGWGGGVRADLAGNEQVVIVDSAILENLADNPSGSTGAGGGLFVGVPSGTTPTVDNLQIYNSTLGKNEAENIGGGILIANGAKAKIVNATIAYNEATGGLEGGGGMYVSSALSGSILMQNTIVANNTAPASPAQGDMYGWKQAGQTNPILSAQSLNNLVGMNHSTMGLPTTGNLYGSYATPLDPQLTPLADNGGASMTYGLSPTSPAIDAGNDAAALAYDLLSDQRGGGYRRFLNGAVDIGSVEGMIIVDAQNNLKVYGTDDHDSIEIYASATFQFVRHQGEYSWFQETSQAMNSVVLFGLDGNDEIIRWAISSTEHLTIYGGRGNDLLEGGGGGATIYGGEGDDGISGGGGVDQLDGGDGNDTLFGLGADDVLVGGAGSDSLYGGNGSDTLNGGAGLDRLYGDAGVDSPEAAGIITAAPVEAIEDIAYSISLDSGNDLRDWYIEWGDGAASTVNATAPTATHFYSDPSFGQVSGKFFATVSRVESNGDLTYLQTFDVKVLSQSMMGPVAVSSTFDQGRQIRLTWTNYVAGATGFEIERSINGLVWTPQATISSGAATSYTTPSGIYAKEYFRIRTKRGSESSDWVVHSLGQTVYQEDEKAIKVSAAAVNNGSDQIVLSWPDEYDLHQEPTSILYTIYRKGLSDASWGQPIAQGNAQAIQTTWTDTTVSEGQVYEYRIERTGGSLEAGTGYVTAAVERSQAQHESRGAVVLLIDDRFDESLAFEIERLKQDLVGDGWNVIEHYVTTTSATPSSVKALIKAEYDANPTSVKSVLLLGHFPVVRSGYLNPDGHFSRSLEADAYYGDVVYPDVDANIDGIRDDPWTDTVLNETGANVFRSNVPNDGKLDVSYIADDGDGSPMELAVGRIDMWDLPAFDASLQSGGSADPTLETELLRRYLNKNHAFRHAEFLADRKALTQTRHNYERQEGFQNFSALVGADDIDAMSWDQARAEGRSYLWAHASGSGGWTIILADGGETNTIIDTPKLAATSGPNGQPHLGVFNVLTASFVLEWNRSDNLMRAILADDGYGLVSTWGNLGNFEYFQMGVGGTIGEAYLTTQNRDEVYFKSSQELNSTRSGEAEVYTALMGDPTLRMHVVRPASNVNAAPSAGEVDLTWSRSIEDPAGGGTTMDGGEFIGYHVYRATSVNGPFERITANAVSGLFFTDENGTSGHVYMVRAVKLENTPSGSYYNLSQGAFSHQLMARVAAVNVGSTSAVSSPGGSFAGDTSGGTTLTTMSAINLALSPSVPIGAPTSLFQSAKIGASNWSFNAVSGEQYAVRLYFAEIDAANVNEAGDRVFDVAIEGVTVLNDFDIFASVGLNRGVAKTFVTTAIGNQLNIGLSSVVGSPLIAGIEIFKI